MKVNIYYDILVVPPRHVLKWKRRNPYDTSRFNSSEYDVERYRFVLSQSHHVLLAPGQTYVMDWDPVGESVCADFLVEDSGLYSFKGRTQPFIVIKDEFVLDFDRWLEDDPPGRAAVTYSDPDLLIKVRSWSTCVQHQFNDICGRMLSAGWERMSSAEKSDYYNICQSSLALKE